MTPVMVAAVRRYTTTAQRSVSFSIFYAVMNAGFGIGVSSSSRCARSLGRIRPAHAARSCDTELSTYRTTLLASFVLPSPACCWCTSGPGRVEAHDNGVRVTRRRAQVSP